MSKLVQTVEISTVADLYTQYARFARSYDLADNPLVSLTSRIPRKAEFYTIVPTTDTQTAELLMKKIAGRKKLRRIDCHRDEIRHSVFLPTQFVTIFYA